MKLSNSFSLDTRSLFLWNYECWICGQNSCDALHHIFGREFSVATSPLNAAPVCNFKCHIGYIFREEDKKMMVQKTVRWLLKQDYQFTEIDKAFIMKYLKYYEIEQKN